MGNMWGAKLFTHRKLLINIIFLVKMVRVKGLEPPRHRRQNLNLVRLPIPPHPHWRGI